MLSNLDIELYTTQGYLVVENVLKEPILTLARETCNAAVNWKEKQMQDAGINDDGINLLNRRYFISCRKEKYFMERNISNNLDKIIFNGNERFKAIDDVIDYWKTFNKNFEEPIVESLGEGFEKTTYNSDENSSSTVHYKITYGGHTWDYSSDENLKTGKLLWDFFRNYRKIN